MNSAQQETLRNLIDEPAADAADLQRFWDQTDGSLFGAAALIWASKAAYYVKKVNQSTGNNRIEFGEKHAHALKQTELFTSMAGGVEGLGAGAGEVMESITMSTPADFKYDGSTEYTFPDTPPFYPGGMDGHRS